MLQGKITAALRWITTNNLKALNITPEIVFIIERKHPKAAPTAIDRVFSGEIPKGQRLQPA